MLHALVDPVVGTSVVDWGSWKFTGDFTSVDLIAAATNALNGALIARRPDHFRNFTIVGVLLMALLGGIGGGITRDILVNKVPSAVTNPAYLAVALAAGLVGYFTAYASGQKFREGWFQLMTSFSLPWLAVAGAQIGIKMEIPVLGCVLLAVVGSTAGRCYIDLVCGVTPEQFVRSEWVVGTAVLTGSVWILLYGVGLSAWPSTLLAWAFGFTFRVLATRLEWEEPLASAPGGLREHDPRNPLFGRRHPSLSGFRVGRDDDDNRNKETT